MSELQPLDHDLVNSGNFDHTDPEVIPRKPYVIDAVVKFDVIDRKYRDPFFTYLLDGVSPEIKCDVVIIPDSVSGYPQIVDFIMIQVDQQGECIVVALHRTCRYHSVFDIIDVSLSP